MYLGEIIGGSHITTAACDTSGSRFKRCPSPVIVCTGCNLLTDTPPLKTKTCRRSESNLSCAWLPTLHPHPRDSPKDVPAHNLAVVILVYDSRNRPHCKFSEISAHQQLAGVDHHSTVVSVLRSSGARASYFSHT